jgi:hypothetical protein
MFYAAGYATEVSSVTWFMTINFATEVKRNGILFRKKLLKSRPILFRGQIKSHC